MRPSFYSSTYTIDAIIVIASKFIIYQHFFRIRFSGLTLRAFSGLVLTSNLYSSLGLHFGIVASSGRPL